MTKKIINHIAFVLDKSGSMLSLRDRTVKAINEQLDVIEDAQDGQEDNVILVAFNGGVDDPLPLDVTRRFTNEDYSPRGSTALYDAIGKTIEIFQDISTAYGDSDDVSFLLVILSDGEENSSREYNGKRISGLVKELELQGNWTFTFIGADANCLETIRSMNFSYGNTMSYDATAHGTQVASSGMACALMNYKNARNYTSNVGNFYNA